MGTNFKYKAIRDTLLKEALSNDQFRLPSERDIAKIYGVSRNTAKNALNDLLKDKLVDRGVGKGTYIKPQQIKRRIHIFHNAPPDLFQHFKNEVQRYVSIHTQVEVEWHQVNRQTIFDAISSVTGSKILIWPNFGYFKHVGLLKNLAEFDDFSEVEKKTIKKLLETSKFKGKKHCYSLPLFTDIPLLGINHKIAAQIGCPKDRGPETWEELLKWCQRAQLANVGVMDQVFAQNAIDQRVPLSWYYCASHRRPMLNLKNGKLEFDFCGGKKWLTFFSALNEFTSNKPLGIGEGFFSGQLLFGLNTGSWAHLTMSGELKEDVSFCSIPTIDQYSESSTRQLIGGGAIIADQSNSELEQEETWKLLKHLSISKAAQDSLVEESSFLPVVKEVRDRLKKENSYAPFYDMEQYAVVREDHSSQHGTQKVISTYFIKVMNGEIEIDDAILRIQEMCDLLIEIDQESHPQW